MLREVIKLSASSSFFNNNLKRQGGDYEFFYWKFESNNALF